ncbi:MAG TPA: hypothetical protein VFQ53_01800 [Kofleriaceae bacterium]|nr:hypothetical protein [Kofleriaceae bacterium]
MTKDTEDPLVAQAFDAAKHEDLARAIEQLSPEEATFFLTKLEAALKKRKIQLTGYLVALVVWLITTVFALAYYGVAEGFVGWVFLVPFGLVGLILYLFGKWAQRVGASTKLPAAKIEAKPDK